MKGINSLQVEIIGKSHRKKDGVKICFMSWSDFEGGKINRTF